jgi:hypothetical protein
MMGSANDGDTSAVRTYAHERGAMMIGVPQTRPPRILLLIFMLAPLSLWLM